MWELDHKESWKVKKLCFWTVVLGKTLESPLDCKIKPVHPKGSVLNIHWKDWCWSWSSKNLTTWCEKSTPWKRPWCWERLKVGEGDDRGWDGWMASRMWWTWVWIGSGSWWRTGSLACCSPWCCEELDITDQLKSWVTMLHTMDPLHLHLCKQCLCQ